MENSVCVFRNKSNQKGFSLVELLIVIAIMGVLAVIAFQAFNGVLQNSKKRADEAQAGNIVKAVRLLITDTGISDLATEYTKIFTDNTASTNVPAITADQPGVEALVIALQDILYVNDPVTGVIRGFGPYLTNPKGTGAATYDGFAPQWRAGAGGSHIGYVIEISLATNNVRGLPVVGGSGSCAFQTDGEPGVLVQP